MNIIKFIKTQIRVIRANDPAIRNSFEVLLYPSFHAILRHKIAHYFYNRKNYFIARYISQKTRKKTGIEIHPGAKIKDDLFMDHGMGIVIGETAEVGHNVVIFHGVTLGGTGKDKGKRHPTILDNVFIGAHSQILGPIVIGNNSKVGAASVVLNDVPDSVTVVGVPSKVVRINEEK